MQVKIIKCSGKSFWYNRQIGATLNVHEYSTSPNDYFLDTKEILNNGDNFFVQKSDCEVLGKPSELERVIVEHDYVRFKGRLIDLKAIAAIEDPVFENFSTVINTNAYVRITLLDKKEIIISKSAKDYYHIQTEEIKGVKFAVDTIWRTKDGNMKAYVDINDDSELKLVDDLKKEMQPLIDAWTGGNVRYI